MQTFSFYFFLNTSKFFSKSTIAFHTITYNAFVIMNISRIKSIDLQEYNCTPSDTLNCCLKMFHLSTLPPSLPLVIHIANNTDCVSLKNNLLLLENNYPYYILSILYIECFIVLILWYSPRSSPNKCNFNSRYDNFF